MTAAESIQSYERAQLQRDSAEQPVPVDEDAKSDREADNADNLNAIYCD